MAKVRNSSISAFTPGMPNMSMPSCSNSEVQVTTQLHHEASTRVPIEIPLAEHYPPTEFMVHLDTRLTLEQSSVLRRIARQLDLGQACLKNGQRVINANSAIKWLLEKVADELAMRASRS